jgi:hypothetical protein
LSSGLLILLLPSTWGLLPQQWLRRTDGTDGVVHAGDNEDDEMDFDMENDSDDDEAVGLGISQALNTTASAPVSRTQR